MAYTDFPPPRGPPAPAGPYQLTREEKRVLKECNNESFYRRCVPFMTALGLGAYYGVHLGYLKGSPNYGSAPKVAAGLFVGFVAGKLSYKKKCEEKILRLPGGKLKEAILMSRKSRDRLFAGSPDDSGVYTDATISYAMPPYTGGSFAFNEPRSGSDIDTERPIDTFDDSFKIRPDSFEEPEHGLPIPSGSQFTSYDELRNRNRDEYESKRRHLRPSAPGDYSPYSGPYVPPTSVPPVDDRFHKATPYQPVVEQSPSSEYRYSADSTFQNPSRTPIQRKNFYGDTIDK